MGLLDKVFPWQAFARFLSSPVPATEGQVIPLRTSALGELLVSLVGGPPVAVRDPVIGASKRIVRAQPTALVEVFGFNDGSDTYLQLHNAAAEPANNSHPLLVVKAPAGEPFSLTPSSPWPFSNGLVWLASSTMSTLTKDTGASLVVYTSVQ